MGLAKNQQDRVRIIDENFAAIQGDEKMKEYFAKEMIRQMLYAPTESVSGTTYTKYSRDQILTWLLNPTSNDENLRNASNYMYISSQHYQRLVQYFAGLMAWCYVMSPYQYSGEEKNDIEGYKKAYYNASVFLENFGVYDEMRKIMVVVFREGVYYGVRWTDKTSSFVQTINPKFCRINFISDGVFLYEVDMSKIKEKDLEKYPAEFTTMFRAYSSTGVKWQLVPSEISVCIKFDPTMLQCSIPPFAAALPQLYRIADSESREEISADMENYKMISAEVPVDSEGNPVIGYDLVEKYYRQVMKAIGAKVGVTMTPFKMTSFNFDRSSSTREIDQIQRTVSNFWQTAGTSALLHGVADDTTGIVQLGIKNDETYVFGVVKQMERLMNRILKTELKGKYKFKINFLPITIFNREEMIKQFKEAISFGAGVLLYLSAVGIPQHDIAGLSFIEKDVLQLDKILVPLLNSYNSSTKEAGRPQKSDTDLSDAGEVTREDESNINR